MRRLFQILVTFTLCLSVGVHWGLMQTVAWAGMIVRYTQSASFPQALEMTLDGKHPCKLCKIVQAGRAKERQEQSETPGKKLDPWIASDSVTLIFTAAPSECIELPPAGLFRLYPPPVPPPLA